MKIAAACLMMLVVQDFGQEFKWNKIEVDGVNYVSVSQLASFYSFKEPEIKGDEVTLKNKDLIMVFEIGAKKASFNKVGFLLGRELVKEGEDHLVSVDDLTLIIDPVLRPARVRGLGEFDTVIFDLDFPEGYLNGSQFETEIQKSVETQGFKAVFLNDGAEPAAVLAKLQDGFKGGSAVYLEISLRQGEDGLLKTCSVGGLTKQSLALATGIHWSALKGLKQAEIVGVDDGLIALGEGEKLKKLKFPGCRMELTMDFASKTTPVDQEKLHRSIARSLGQALVFTRKAGRQRQAKEFK